MSNVCITLTHTMSKLDNVWVENCPHYPNSDNVHITPTGQCLHHPDSDYVRITLTQTMSASPQLRQCPHNPNSDNICVTLTWTMSALPLLRQCLHCPNSDNVCITKLRQCPSQTMSKLDNVQVEDFLWVWGGGKTDNVQVGQYPS